MHQTNGTSTGQAMGCIFAPVISTSQKLPSQCLALHNAATCTALLLLKPLSCKLGFIVSFSSTSMILQLAEAASDPPTPLRKGVLSGG